MRLILIGLLLICFLIPNICYAADKELNQNNFQLELIKRELVKEVEKPTEVVYEKVPLYLQTDYPDNPYGNYGTIASHGCGITSLAMVATYLTDIEYTPVVLAEQFGHYNTPRGSYWSLFKDSAKILELGRVKQTSDWSEVYNALKNNQVVIAVVGSDSIFTSSGHYIVLAGLTEDGKIIVNDPNGRNYKKVVLSEGFENGFTEVEVYTGAKAFWIYEQKNFNEKITEDIEEDVLEEFSPEMIEFLQLLNTTIIEEQNMIKNINLTNIENGSK